MKHKRRLINYTIGVLILITIIVYALFIKRNNSQMCIYEDDNRRFSIEIPKDWTYKIYNKFTGNETIEGSPDYGIEIYIDGDKNHSIYFFYQEGTLNLSEPGMSREAFKTKRGQSGNLSAIYNDNTTRIVIVFDIGHYAITTELDNSVFSVNKNKIFSMFKSIYIKEF